MKVKVKASVVVEVDVPDGWEPSDIKFHIEENHCPGTGEVGAAIDEAYEHGKTYSVCWACNLQGQNEILEIYGKPVQSDLVKRYLNDPVFHALCETMASGVRSGQCSLEDLRWAVTIAKLLLENAGVL